MESTPLLADPPIDDDLYQYEEQPFPTNVQKHFLYAEFFCTVSLVRILEGLYPFFIALVFSQSLIPITIYALILVTLAPFVDAQCRTLMLSVPRVRFLKVTVLVRKLGGIAVCLACCYVYTNPLVRQSPVQWLIFASILVAMSVQRGAGTIQTVSLETDWARILSNEQGQVYKELTICMNHMSLVTQLVTPVLVGTALHFLYLVDIFRLVIVALLLSTVAEYAFIYKLYSTCYALFLPRPLHGLHHENASSLAPTVRRVLMYIRRRPRPVTASLGLILTRSSLLVFGPQLLFYLLFNHMPIFYIAVLPAFQLLGHLVWRPWYQTSLLLGATFSVAALWLLRNGKVLVLPVAVVLSRISFWGAEQGNQKFVNSLVQDREVFKVYRQVEFELMYAAEMCVQLLTFIWWSPKSFAIPASIGVATSLVGIALVELAYWWPHS